jgi:hypothetical protein
MGSIIDDGMDLTKPNATEGSIADQLDRRKVVEEKRDASSVVVRAAHDARTAVLAVFEHLGGMRLDVDGR